MTARLQKKPWKEMLPEVYRWVAKVFLRSDVKVSKSDLCLFAVSSDQDILELIQKDSFLAKYHSQLHAVLQSLNIKKLKSVLLVPLLEQRILLVPIRSSKNTKSQLSRQVGLDASKHILDSLASSVGICNNSCLDSLEVFDGLCQGWYEISSFKQKQKQKQLPKEVVFSETFSTEQFEFRKSLVCATLLSRFVGDAPPNWFTSEMFAEIASDIAKEKSLKCTILGGKELKEKGLGSFYSVSKGTLHDPKLIAIEILGKKKDEWVALVGKGLTFDSGGISLKPSLNMDEMKYDMCGGGAVLGAAYCLANHKPPTSVVCLIGAVENMPGNSATRPGDVVTSYSGKTVEVLNTDAEGRLVLADLLHYANQHYKPKCMVDVATLTGAVLMSLGSVGSAIMSNSAKVTKNMLEASNKTGELMWELPMWPEFDKEIASSIADIKNITSPGVRAGTVTAGVFLRSFVENTPWCHLDIAGTAWNCKATGFVKRGGSGFGVRSLVQFCLGWS